MIKMYTTPDENHLVVLNDWELGIAEEAIRKALDSESESTDVVLDYDHVSQMGPGASENRNDCGIACVVAVAREHGYPDLNVDDAANRFQRPNTPMWISEVISALNGYGIPNRYEKHLTHHKIWEYVQDRSPCILLVSYPELPYQFVNYDASHYIVVYGALENGNLLYLDPLGDGNVLEMDAEHTTRALSMVVRDNNTPDQGIILF